MEYLNFVILLIIVIFTMYKSYFAKKGENYATKQDIEEITKKIETVKTEISTINFHKNDLLERRKKALINFQELFIDLTQNYLNDFSYLTTFYGEPEKLNQRMNKIITKYSEVEIAFWKIHLYEIDDVSFLEDLKQIYLIADKYYVLFVNYLHDVELNALKIKRTQLNKFLASERESLNREFSNERAKMKSKLDKLPYDLLNTLRKKYLNLFKEPLS